MEIIARKGLLLEQDAELLVLGMYNDAQKDPVADLMKEWVGDKYDRLVAGQGFEAKAGQSLLFAAPDSMACEYILVCGLGGFNEEVLDDAREAAGIAVQTAKKLGLATIAMMLFGEHERGFQGRLFGQAIAESVLLADYQFTQYKKDVPQQNAIAQVVLVGEDGRSTRAVRTGIEQAESIVAGVTVARDLVNTPALDMTPSLLAQRAREIAKGHAKMRVRVLDREACEKKGMNSYLAVARGSDEEPQFIHITYKPAKAKKRVVLVGKGVTFDSGGLSLKPAKYMETMKCDMAGSASVLGAFEAIAKLSPSVEVHGIIAATENLVSGKAIRPGDVVRASNGLSIEILNTDAEGRLTLADALHYGGKLKPDVMIDLATLTGACVVALGEEIGALMTPDASLQAKLLSSASAAGEKMWALPLEQRYNSLLKSEIADLRNIATSPYGGSLTAGLFLSNFVPEGVPWAHMDIAGPAFAERPLSSYIGKGGTGFAVRTLIHYIQSL